ncbi:unnamed protein product [Darwinula stevensoni]|uniref:Uncharacterized protein n=1 Tax=Darwinula stevensoni TaxID=69355 RepID=A0A7R9FPG9_9CRUS|nr:unnamed protein product [Darwinula stevensoni]CAG0897956.1 unnamed protein product [Darwinula stevensoni]
MRIPVLKKCCCGCMTVRTGSIVIAVFGLVCYGITLLMCLALITGLADWKVGLAAFLPEDVTRQTSVYTVADVVVAIVWIICDSLLLVGVLKMRRKLMIPFLGLQLVWLTLGTIAAIVLFVLFAVNSGSTIFVAVTAVVFVVLYGIAVYFFFVVYSHFKELESSPPPEDVKHAQESPESVPLGDARESSTKSPV